MKKIFAIICAAAIACGALAGCAGQSGSGNAAGNAGGNAAASSAATAGNTLKAGTYSAEFNTDSSMFHVNEAMEGKGVLTVDEKGQATIHIALVSKRITNLFVGTSEDAKKDGAKIIDAQLEEVTYSDGYKQKVNAFDLPVPVIGEEFTVAILGESGNWYDHQVSVNNPQPADK